jgi:hypothetical protein
MLDNEPLYTIRQIAFSFFQENSKKRYWTVLRWFEKEPYFEGGNGTKNKHRLYTKSTIERVKAKRMRGRQ